MIQPCLFYFILLHTGKLALFRNTEAWSHFHKLITEHALHAQSFQGFGSSFIKKSGFPPDAFVQVAMQLATYRLFGEQVATYEATQVRPFL
jgi:carnitine O-acetyltransferase